MVEDPGHLDLLPPRLVIYDGECGLCDATVQRLLSWDRDRALRYTPNQGETFSALKGRWPDLEPGSTVYFLAREDGELHLYSRSTAIFQVCRHLPWPWRAASWLRFLPTALTDAAYRVVARYRIAIWGRPDSCRMPSPGERALFLP